MVDLEHYIRAVHHPDGVELQRDQHRLALHATNELAGVRPEGGRMDRVSIGVDLDIEAFGTDPAFLGYGFTQFALPTTGNRGRPFDWDPAPNLRPLEIVLPLLVRCDDQTVLFAPLDSFHEQVIAVDQDTSGVHGFRWGWQGDLDTIPTGTTSTLGVYEGSTPTDVLAQWRRELAPTTNRAGSDDPLLTHLSYWTDNGAAYWYRREPNLDLASTLEAKLRELDDLGVGIGSVELDSWFYSHEISRPVTEVGYLSEVPPTGMLEWTPRPDVLPDGINPLRSRLGDRPLVLHSRHISTRSPYVDEGEWWIDHAAHPVDQEFFYRWFADAKSWGATCIEQDWMLMTWLGVGQLRSHPGRGETWLRGLDTAAAAHDMTVLYCMATPADLCQAASLDRVIAARTSDDYRYADDPAFLWRWYLGVNRLANIIGVPVFKDCFFSDSDPGDDKIDGDPHAEVESLLAVLGGGVVGIGDRLGRTNVDIVRRIAHPDGRLITPERGLALHDRSLFDDASMPTITWAEAGDGPWRYIVGLHMADTDEAVGGRLDLGGEWLIYDWRTGDSWMSSTITTELGHRDWTLLICCPLDEATEDGIVIGDPTVYATMSAARDQTKDRSVSIVEQQRRTAASNRSA